jgi:hypothetical protein
MAQEDLNPLIPSPLEVLGMLLLGGLVVAALVTVLVVLLVRRTRPSVTPSGERPPGADGSR